MPGIYPLPEKPTAAYIIRRSIIAHPSLFREALLNQEKMHRRYMNETSDGGAFRGAKASAYACAQAASFAGARELNDTERAAEICKDCGTMVIALNVACKLQCLPAHIRTAAAVAWGDAR